MERYYVWRITMTITEAVNSIEHNLFFSYFDLWSGDRDFWCGSRDVFSKKELIEWIHEANTSEWPLEHEGENEYWVINNAKKFLSKFTLTPITENEQKILEKFDVLQGELPPLNEDEELCKNKVVMKFL